MKSYEYHTAEFARLAGVNKKTLLYYDEIGLFCPARIEPNGYRVYHLFQLDRLALIAALRDLGVPLKAIQTYLTRSDPAVLDAVLAQQSEEIDRRMELLQRRRAMLDAVRAQNREFLQWCGKGPQLLHRPAERLTVLADGGKLGTGHLVINYLTDGLNTGLCARGEHYFFYQRRPDGELALPAGDYVCLYEDAGADDEDRLQNWAAARRPVLERWAAAHGLALEQTVYVETNELVPGGSDNANDPLRTVRVPVRAHLQNDSTEKAEM